MDKGGSNQMQEEALRSGPPEKRRDSNGARTGADLQEERLKRDGQSQPLSHDERQPENPQSNVDVNQEGFEKRDKSQHGQSSRSDDMT